jgi:hypothetical protein
MTVALALFAAGWLYALLGFAVLAWLSDRWPRCLRALEHANPWISTLSLVSGLATWPVILLISLPGLWTGATRTAHW